MKRPDIENKTEAALNSLDGLQRAQPQPFLLTRVNAALQNQRLVPASFQEKVAAIISRPTVAFGMLAFVLLVNITVLVKRNFGNQPETRDVTQVNENKEDFAYQNNVLFDIENP